MVSHETLVLIRLPWMPYLDRESKEGVVFNSVLVLLYGSYIHISFAQYLRVLKAWPENVCIFRRGRIGKLLHPQS